MCDLSHENLWGFVGACVDPGHVILITKHYQKGHLDDILYNDDIKLDWVFKLSIATDIISVIFLMCAHFSLYYIPSYAI